MTDDELELKILRRFVEQHRKAGIATPDDKLAHELDMREVLRELTGKAGDELNYDAKLWFTRLVQRPSPGLSVTPLRPGKSGQPYRARAFLVGGSGPAWERIRELERLVGPQQPAGAPSHVTININRSTVASLNLGTVVGNIEAAITTLEPGDPDVASALMRLVEAVLAEEALGGQRREVVESLNQVAEEATKPEGGRRVGLVKTLLFGVGIILTQTAHLSQIWATWGPVISRHFGL